jgi:Dockerin type I domain
MLLTSTKEMVSRRSVSDPVTSILVAVPPAGFAPPYYDVNQDGKATALDALRVINQLARIILAGEDILSLGHTSKLDFLTADELPTDAVFREVEFETRGLPDLWANESLVAERQPISQIDWSYSADSAGSDPEATLAQFADDVARQWAAVLR